MSQYVLIILWIGIMSFLASFSKVQRMEKVLDKEEYRYLPWFAMLTFFPVLYFATTRGGFADTYAYLLTFDDMPSSFRELPQYIAGIKKDKGFYILSALIKIVFGSNETVYLFVLALIQSVIIISVYRKYSSQYLVSIFLFLASTDYISWMFNGLRQFTAVVIGLAATQYILQKRWIPTILLILLASTMHQSALLLFPIAIIVQGKAWNRRTLLFLLATMVAVLFVDQFTNILDDMMQETQYANMVSDWNEWGDDGTNLLRVLVYAVPTILSIVGLKYIRQANDPLINFCTNMSIVSTGLYVISMFTSGIFIGRLPIYASLYNYILLPWQIDNMFTKDSAKLVKYLMIAAYLIFYYYQMHFAWGLF